MPAEKKTPSTTPVGETENRPPDERRRAALRQLGRGAKIAIPTTISLMMINRAAAAS